MDLIFLPMKGRKRLARDGFDIFATHASLAHVTDAECWAQNGSNRSHVFATVKC